MARGVRFGTYEFDSEHRELRKHGLRIRVPDQSLEILAALVERPGETVSRERLQKLLWPHGTAVGFEQSINAAVKRLREALDDPANNPRFIERVPRHGYRFIAPVERLPQEDASVEGEKHAGKTVLHYRLIERAGAGSMGEVWKAEDSTLGRTVALKFISHRLDHDDEALEAFRQEARHAAALNHPNICTIHGLEEHEGQRFLVMEYVDGKPLSAALDGRPLPLTQIVSVGIQAAEALAAAHLGNVAHRDVKPANLMLTAGGAVKLTDFGIAKAAPARSPPSEAGDQTPVGTLGYLSPEQARGEPADARSDLFSLGVVLYEMATGRRPFRGETPAAVLQAVLHQDPAPPRALNPALPRQLARVFLKALEKDPGARWQSAAEMAAALRRIESARRPRLRARLILASAGIAAAAIAVWLWFRPSTPLSERDSIVVADFENRTGEAVFDGALRQALLSQMGQSSYVSVVSEERIRNMLALMGRISDFRLPRDRAQEICQRAGAKAVLSGVIGIVGSRYFLGLDAVGCAAGETLASEYAEAESRDRVLAALSQAAARMRGRLGESLASIGQLGVLAEATTPSLEALRAYSIALRERALGNDPVPLLQRAIELDPDFASAHFTMARVLLGRAQEAAAEDAISRAYALRGRTSERERLEIEGLYHNVASGDAQKGIAVAALASQLYPYDSSSWRWSVLAYFRVGEFEKALQVARREVEVDPYQGESYFDLAIVLICFGRNAEARAVLEKGGARGAKTDLFPFVRYLLAALEGDSAAMEREEQYAKGKPSEHRVLIIKAQMAGYLGQLAKARQTIRAPADIASVALTEVIFGLEHEARIRANSAIRLDRGRRTGATCAFTLALANESAAAEAILSDLLRRYPNDTVLNSVWLPSVRGAIALRSGDARRAAKPTDAHLDRFAWPAYVRAVAYLKLGQGAQAAAEFRRILERRAHLFAGAFAYGAAFAYPAAQLGLARALAMDGQVEASRRVYEEFLAGWSKADPDIPILLQAKAEHAALKRGLPPGASRK